MLIRRTTPYNIDRFFNEWNNAINTTNNKSFALDVHENDDAFTVQAEVPGIDADNINIRLHEDTLTIEVENSYENREERGDAILQERRYGSFSRSLRFPVHVNSDNVSADYTDGVLTITVPKAEEVKPRRIEINRA
ncbi:MAG: Hsp20/alpha crystallin family protein [Chloroflexota bacterium]